MSATFLADPLTAPVFDPAADEMARHDTGRLGYVMNLTRLWGHLPQGNQLLGDLLEVASTTAGLTERERALLVMTTAATIGDSYCTLAWGRRLVGEMGADVVAGIVAGTADPLDLRERALVWWARRMAADPNGVRDQDVDTLREVGYDDRQVFAITLYVAMRIGFSTVNDALGAGPDVELVGAVPASLRAAVTFGRAAAGAIS